ncbi:ribosomal L7Ae/L30e/S12e/Gadd45 family protein [Fodinisporobacter ferrooxydans]|uniref:Ribosomal L7Ae/L30e/S12e/Gadd45 family protein n=1 Tax=Fodinisporobacter ferrooxydans TaxID=2901836 RepID=A0ABY4CN24_9BACL|nr:ribosomal L7Ae/L30e/S12e/Gadd45 family protein [Alicyclobacillaceae bacterium MYW30-H2]
MPYDRIRHSKHVVIGTNQTIRLLLDAKIAEVFLAKDADERITSSIMQLCQEHNVSFEWIATMKMLGKACGIQVGAAVAAIKKNP